MYCWLVVIGGCFDQLVVDNVMPVCGENSAIVDIDLIKQRLHYKEINSNRVLCYHEILRIG